MNKRSRKYFEAKKPQQGGITIKVNPYFYESMRGMSRVDRIRKMKAFWKLERSFWRAKSAINESAPVSPEAWGNL